MSLSFRLDGDFGALEAWGERAGSLGSNASMRGLSRELADEGLFQVQLGFQQQRDPYGLRWARKEFPDGARILHRSGRLRSSWRRFAVFVDGFTIGSAAWYSKFHQSGTGIYGPRKRPIRPKRAGVLRFKAGGRFRFAREVRGSVPRKMVPDRGRPSQRWSIAFRTRAIAYLSQRMSGSSRMAA